MNVYLISGLGMDERAFQRLSFPASLNIIYIRWPQHEEQDSLDSYCQKIVQLIDTTLPFSIIGFSFGGIIAVELTRMVKATHTIILSSVATWQELPRALRIFRTIPLHRLAPVQQMNKTSPVMEWFNSLPLREDNDIIASILKDTDPHFIKWATDKIVNWENTIRPPHIYHIHGSADRLFPVANVQADKVIQGGGHFMVLTHAGQISEVLCERLGEKFQN